MVLGQSINTILMRFLMDLMAEVDEGKEWRRWNTDKFRK